MSPEKLMRTGTLALLTAVALLAGCATPSGESTTKPACDTRNFDEVTLQPGCTGFCTMQPCAISFRLPDNGGPFEIRSRSFLAGTGNNGETVKLGSYWMGSYIFKAINAVGEPLPPAYLTVSGDPESGAGD